jgi:uncharacterized protein (DUF4415 family)
VDALRDQDIDMSDNAELKPEMLGRAIARRGLKVAPPKRLLTLRIDEDVVGWFRSHGRGYQTEINALLRAYMDESQRK